jgi:PIN like domain
LASNEWSGSTDGEVVTDLILMKATFPGWYAKTSEDLKVLWDRAILVPDTNILLHLIRHSANIRSQLMAVFERKKEALWIPYQVGAEFQRRRLDVQQHALDAYDRLAEEVKASANQARNKLNQYRAHPVIDIEGEVAALDVYHADFEKRMAAARLKHPTDELAASFIRVTDLFAGRVGAKPTEERLTAIRKEGEERYAKKIPPGFEDAKKGTDGGDKFGDLIIWKEMIEKAKADKRPLIFVTDDGKSDWWYIHHGKKVGPHPQLVEEFLTATGQQFHIYELPQFLRYSVETGSAIQPDAVQRIADTMIADTQAASNQTAATERALATKALRSELRSKEFELDSLIKSLIDFPPRTGEEAPRDDLKRPLKLRIGELTEVVSTLRERLIALESEFVNATEP